MEAMVQRLDRIDAGRGSLANRSTDPQGRPWSCRECVKVVMGGGEKIHQASCRPLGVEDISL